MRKLGPRNPIVVRIIILISIIALVVGIAIFAFIQIANSNALNYEIGDKNMAKNIKIKS